jgi:hypothetical protein
MTPRSAELHALAITDSAVGWNPASSPEPGCRGGEELLRRLRSDLDCVLLLPQLTTTILGVSEDWVCASSFCKPWVATGAVTIGTPFLH